MATHYSILAWEIPETEELDDPRGPKCYELILCKSLFLRYLSAFSETWALVGHRGGRGCLHSLSGLHHLHPGAPKTPCLPPS